MSDREKIPAVAVIVPVHCRTEENETYLGETLDSIAAQTFTDFEVVIVDDASPRDIGPVVARLRNPARVRVIRNETNLGHAQSRNVGIRATQAEFIAFLDHDDLWEPEKLARQIDVLRRNPRAGMVFCRVKVFGSHAKRLSIDQSVIPPSPSFTWFVCHGNFVITSSAVMARREAIEEVGLFDPRYSTCDDFDAWLKILRTRPVLYMSDQLTGYRLHSSNVNYGVDRLNDSRLLTALIWDYWKTARLGEKLILLPRIGRKLIGRAYFHLFRYRSFAE